VWRALARAGPATEHGRVFHGKALKESRTPREDLAGPCSTSQARRGRPRGRSERRGGSVPSQRNATRRAPRTSEGDGSFKRARHGCGRPRSVQRDTTPSLWRGDDRIRNARRPVASGLPGGTRQTTAIVCCSIPNGRIQLVRRPGLKRSHCLSRKVEMEGAQGSIAKRWLRRTEKKC